MGRRRMVKSLGTRDHHVAIARRHAALAEFQKAYEQARAPAGMDSIAEAALAWRETFDQFDRGDYSGFGIDPKDFPDLSENEAKRFVARVVLEEEADIIEGQHGREAAAAFSGIARGTATPLLLHVDSWLREGGVKGPLNACTAAQYKSDLAAIAEWGKTVGVTTIDGFTKQAAGRFVTEQLVQRGIQWATPNRKITAASAYWRWLRKRTGTDANPWAGQSLSKGAGRTAEKPKRPFSDAELTTLLAGDADPELADVIRVAALSGARIEELYRLTVADCTDGWFRIRASKTRAGVRRVPIHIDLADIVAKRREGEATQRVPVARSRPCARRTRT